MYPVKDNFDSAWYIHEGELSDRPRRLVSKGNIASYAADITKKETGPDAGLNILEAVSGEAAQISCKRLEELDSNWKTVDLPHDWRIHHAPSPKKKDTLRQDFPFVFQGFRHPGVAYYRKTFSYDLPSEDEHVHLLFDGVIGRSDYWMNGFWLGSHSTSYTPVSFDVTEFFRPAGEGPNVVLVRSDCTEAEGWWYEGGGISRHVWLERRHAITVAEHGFSVTYPRITQHEVELQFSVEVENHSRSGCKPSVSIDVLSPDGQTIGTISQTVHIPWLETTTASLGTTVETPELWNIGDGKLYTAVVELRLDNKIVYQKEQRFGIRTIEFQKDGILVNGTWHKIKGVNIHADFAGVGVALPDRLAEKKLELLREMGSNTVRIAHHPPAPEIVDHADRMGIFVIPENRLLSSSPSNLQFLRTMVRQFRNSPSVLLWSLENEEMGLQGTETGKRILTRLVKEVNKLDPSRQTNCGGIMYTSHDYHNVTSVIGIHYQGLFNGVEKTVNYFPDKPHIEDEVGLHAPTRGVYKSDTERGHNSAFANLQEVMPEIAGLASFPAVGSGDFASRDNIATVLNEVFTGKFTTGGCLWTGIDYHGEPVPAAWPVVISGYGARDIIGIPKDYYWLLRSLFKPEPLVHGFPHWTWPGDEGKQIPFRVYSNCEEAEVLVNNIVVDRQPVTNSAAYFPDGIKYSPGEVLIRGIIAGKTVAEHKYCTAGKAARVLLENDRPKLAPNNTDIAMIRVIIVDSEGHLVPDAPNLIKFRLGGVDSRIVGVGNGDNATTESEQGDTRTAFNGYAAVMVQSSKELGVITVQVEAEGLEGAQTEIEVSSDVRPSEVYFSKDEMDSPAGLHISS